MTKTAFREYVYSLLHLELTPQNKVYLIKAFKDFHPGYTNVNLVDVSIGACVRNPKNKAFYFSDSDGVIYNPSPKKLCMTESQYLKTKVKPCFRDIIQPQVDKVKSELNFKDHCDHIIPFEVLLRAYLVVKGRTIEEYIPMMNNDYKFLDDDWYNMHNKYARFRNLPAADNFKYKFNKTRTEPLVTVMTEIYKEDVRRGLLK